MTTWAWPEATVVRVIDGDSLVVRLTRDVGFHGSVTFEQRVRLAGINTPPLSTNQGRDAANWVEAHTMGTLTVTTLKPYKYGDEWMALLTLADGRDVSDTLVALGLAYVWNGRGSRPGG